MLICFSGLLHLIAILQELCVVFELTLRLILCVSYVLHRVMTLSLNSEITYNMVYDSIHETEKPKLSEIFEKPK